MGIHLTFILRGFNSVFAFTVLSFPLNRCTFDNKRLYLVNRRWWNSLNILQINQRYFSSKMI